MDRIDNFAAFGAPIILIILGYGLLWWTRLSPKLGAAISRFWGHAHLHASHKRH